MSKRSNTFPYTNARSEGRTQPGLVEFIDKDDPRHSSYRNPETRPAPNRADKRAWAKRFRQPSQVKRSAGGRRIARPKCQHGTPLPYPWSQRTVHCETCAAEVTALLARQAAEAQARADEAAAAKGSRRRRTTPKEA